MAKKISKTKKPRKNSYHKVTYAHEPRAKFIKRVTLYTFFTALTIFLSVLIFYRAKGYTFTKNGRVEKRGILLINSAPISSKIYIDGKDIGKKTDYKLEIDEGSHNLRLEANGYRTWEKNFSIKAEEVEWFYYPYLIPNSLVSKDILTNIPKKTYSSLNSDSKVIAVSKSGLSLAQSYIFEELNLKEDDPANISNTIIVPSQIFTRQADGSLGDIKFDKWSPNGDSIFLEHTFDDNKELINLRVDAPAESTNLTNSVGVGINQYRYDDKSKLYLNKNGELAIYNPVSLVKEQIIDIEVLDFNNFRNSKYVYSKTSKDAEKPGIQVLIKDDQNSPKLVNTLFVGNPKDLDFQYTANRRDYYLSISNLYNKELIIYKNPLDSMDDNTKVSNPLFLSTFESMKSNQIKESIQGSPQPGTYIAIHLSENTLFIYNFEKESSQTFTLNNLKINDFSWIDSEHLQLKTTDEKIFYIDYDGNYLNEITSTSQVFSYFIKSKNKTITINEVQPGLDKISEIKFKD
ncbi:MAG: PEGA domain-containing protein [Candidatus Nomurabacteria bacterium]|nr:MAG: PEGA domain-containing protein [Candidatus Nomurabacteria bacterium]HRV75831.1 PEGA domain-containing protein [Candidatus Saccharimonadales bacterium]